MNHLDACIVLGLRGNVTPKHVATAYIMQFQKHSADRQFQQKINAAYSTLKDFSGDIFCNLRAG